MNPPALRIRRTIHLLGALELGCLGALALLSHGMAPLLPFGDPVPEKVDKYQQAGAALAHLSGGIETFLAGNSFLANRTFLLASYCVPMLVATVVFVVVLAALSRDRDSLETSDAKRLLKWGIAFAVATAFSSPVLTDDFWISFGWGRMVAAGQNPYESLVPIEFIRNLPKGPYFTTMTYGPLWAIVSGSVMLVAQESTVLGAVLFKLVLAGAWILALLLIDRLLRDEAAWYRCAGIVIFGWLPLSVTQSVGDGHNDVLMVLFVLLWLYLLRQTRPILASATLACSAAVKYVTMPLFLLDLLHHVRRQRVSIGAYLSQLVLAAVVILAAFLPFFRLNGFFEPTVSMRDWHFYTPTEAVSDLALLLGVSASWSSFPGVLFAFLKAVIHALFLLTPVYFVARYSRKATWRNLHGAVLAIMSAILFVGVGHVWPWFIVWAIAPAALIPASGLARWVVGVAIAAPFPTLAWTAFPPEAGSGTAFWVRNTAGVLLYGTSVIWFIASRRLFLAPTADQREASSGQRAEQW